MSIIAVRIVSAICLIGNTLPKQKVVVTGNIKMNEKNLLFIDAETDGLYGTFLSVAMIVAALDGQELSRAYYGLKQELLDEVKTPWVRENVLSNLGDYEPCNSEAELLERVWAYWQKYKENTYMVVDVSFPVEVRLMQSCVLADPENRSFDAPYPFLDLSSMLYTVGIDPLTERKALLGSDWKNLQHNAMYDVETAMEIWKKYIRRK